MTSIISRVLILTALLAISSALAFGRTADELATLAVDGDGDARTEAVSELRSMGRVGLDALFVKYAAEIENFKRTGVVDEGWDKIAAALDAVAMQKDAYASHLYWYTNIEDAKREADRRNKPILSLRLLGNLNEEFSCANSRLFRAVLYPNADVSKYLRDNYVLHWRSVRPAPRITIDFGDGRKIERTITGNSIHYILAEDGRIIDALPGLYSPVAFLKYLKQGKKIDTIIGGMARGERDLALMKYRKAAFDEIVERRTKGVDIAKVKLTEPREGTTAVIAAPVATTKMVVTDEYTLLRVYDDFAKFEATIDFSDWDRLAKLYSPNVELDENSLAFIRRQNKDTGLTTSEYEGMLAKLGRFIGLDTTRNDFLYHTRLYQWLNEGRGGELEPFNERVYSDIFKTPSADKWLGLYANDVYTALDGNGITK